MDFIQEIKIIKNKMTNWREKIGKDISDHLEAQINESTKYKEAYETAPDKGKAQLWVAIATLSKQFFDLNLKIKYLEGVLKELDKKINDTKIDVEKTIKESKKEIKKDEVKKEDKLIADVEKEMEKFVKEMPKLEEKKEIKSNEEIKTQKKPRITEKKKKNKSAKITKTIKKAKKKQVKIKKKSKNARKKSLARILKKF